MKIAVIIPTFNEEPIIVQAVADAWSAGADEVVVVDGGSTDQTVQLATQQNCRLIQSDRGRGNQLNTGAEHSSASVLLFLHADTRLGDGGCDQIRDCIAQGGHCGAFRQNITASGWVYRLLEAGNCWRAHWLQMAYGDQGIFVTRELFDELGGFANFPVMEDFDFSRRLKQRKYKYKLLPGPLSVDARRWQNAGPIRQTLSNWRTIFSYCRGTHPKDLRYGTVRVKD